MTFYPINFRIIKSVSIFAIQKAGSRKCYKRVSKTNNFFKMANIYTKQNYSIVSKSFTTPLDLEASSLTEKNRIILHGGSLHKNPNQEWLFDIITDHESNIDSYIIKTAVPNEDSKIWYIVYDTVAKNLVITSELDDSTHVKQFILEKQGRNGYYITPKGTGLYLKATAKVEGQSNYLFDDSNSKNDDNIFLIYLSTYKPNEEILTNTHLEIVEEEFVLSNNYTKVAIVKLTSTIDKATANNIISGSDIDSQHAFFIRNEAENGQKEDLYLYTGHNSKWYNTETTFPTDGEEHHVAVTYDGLKNEMKLYLDKKFMVKNTIENFINTKSTIIIGGIKNPDLGIIRTFSGTIQNVQIWNGVLTDDDIANL